MSNNTLEMPFAIGQVMWLPSNGAEKVRVPCPVCAGQCAVVIVLGTGEQVGVECDACGLGFEGPRGYIEEYQWTPAAVRFVIAKVERFDGERWSLRSETGAWAEWDALLPTEAEALERSRVLCAAQEESNMQSRQRKRAGVKGRSWSLQYHRNCIADLERQIQWHQSKIQAKGQKEGS